MTNYFDINYPESEYSVTAYPQKLCDYLTNKYLGNFHKGANLLDIGCGRGNYLVGFSRCEFSVSGVDKRMDSTEIAKTFHVQECDLEHEPLPFNEGTFDIVFSKSVIEHMLNPDHILSEIYRVLSPEGMALILTPAWEKQYKFFYNDYTHVKPYTRKGLQNALRLNRFQSVECNYFIQLPLVWRYPFMKYFADMIALLPDCLTWKDSDERQHRKLIRFSKEKMLLAVGRKS